MEGRKQEARKEGQMWLGGFLVAVILVQPVHGQGFTFPVDKESRWDTIDVAPRSGFAVSLLVNQATDGIIEFEASDSLMYRVVAHPSSDIEVKDDKLNIRCKGLDSHPTQTASEGSSDYAILTIRSKSIGSYTVLWWNPAEVSSTLRYEVRSDNGQVMILDRSTGKE